MDQNLKAPSKDVSKFSKNLLKKWDSFFTFIYHEGVEPTNNLGELLQKLNILFKYSGFSIHFIGLYPDEPGHFCLTGANFAF